jgi:hypothetical protein
MESGMRRYELMDEYGSDGHMLDPIVNALFPAVS